MKASIFTLGCRVNQYESDSAAEMLEQEGFETVPFGTECDITVINTCTVTAESDRKSRQHIRRAKNISPAGHVIVTGCYAQRDPEGAFSAGADAVLGNGEKSKIAETAKRLICGEKNICLVSDIQAAPYDNVRVSKPTKARAYIKIEDGCENRCAYCIIPKARGKVRSRPFEDCLFEICEISKKGYTEFILTGIETASYGRDLKDRGLLDLLLAAGELEGVKRLTMGSLEPTVMTEKFCEGLARVKGLLPHFHLSIQSGCTKTLNRMRRKYTAEKALASIERVRKYIPDATFSADIIVGFPGETEEDFLETAEFCKKADFLHLHIFPYSKREGTEAAEMEDQVPDNIKKERAAALSGVAKEMQKRILSDYVKCHGEDSPVSVLCEMTKNGIANGHTPHFIECNFPADRDRTGEIVSVVPERFEGNVLIGRPLN